MEPETCPQTPPAAHAPKTDARAPSPVQYILHPTPPDAKGERRFCAHVVARKTYSLEAFAERVAQENALLDKETVLHVIHCIQKTSQAILREGNSIAFKNHFTLQLSISGSFDAHERPDPKKGHRLRPRVRVAPALIEAINQGIAFEPLAGRTPNAGLA